jgi:UrcA family protein
MKRMLASAAFTLALALALALALVAAPAQAEAASVGRSVEVPYGDLDLTRPEGAAALYERLERAAARACRPAGRSPIALHPHEMACRRDALERAVAAVDSGPLLRLHAERTGRAVAVAGLAAE